MLKTLIFSRERLAWTEGASLRKSVDALPTRRVALMRVVSACLAAEKIEALVSAKFSLPSFIEASQLLRAASFGPYVELVLKQETHSQKTIRGILNPATVNYWSHKLRAFVGIFGDMFSEEDMVNHAEQIRQKIKTIT
jgi:hypothetical protein